MTSMLSWAIIEYGSPEFDAALALRDDILRKPLKLQFHPEDIAKEFDQWHFGAFDSDDRLIGVLTLQIITSEIVKMRQVAISSYSQSKGVGSYLVGISEEFARQAGYKKIILHARDTAVPFYEKLNYHTIDNVFYEVNIPHYKMEKNL